MRFLIDAQLPLTLKRWLKSQGVDVIHTLDLTLKNYTDDFEVIRVANNDNRIVISKDSDFFKYHLLKGEPERILMITTGNIVNKELIRLFELNFSTILELFEQGSKIIEMNTSSITVHKD
jgi:predicted nuclease of predicted toxin-antitoxin system